MRYTLPREVCWCIEKTETPLLHAGKLHSKQKCRAGFLRERRKTEDVKKHSRLVA